MFWKLWKKTHTTGGPPKAKEEKLPRPKDIPEPVGRYLVVNLQKNPDWVWNLKGAVRQRQEGQYAFDVRVFDEKEASEKRVNVKNYTSLDEHPELILFE